MRFPCHGLAHGFLWKFISYHSIASKLILNTKVNTIRHPSSDVYQQKWNCHNESWFAQPRSVSHDYTFVEIHPAVGSHDNDLFMKRATITSVLCSSRSAPHDIYPFCAVFSALRYAFFFFSSRQVSLNTLLKIDSFFLLNSIFFNTNINAPNLTINLERVFFHKFDQTQITVYFFLQSLEVASLDGPNLALVNKW